VAPRAADAATRTAHTLIRQAGFVELAEPQIRDLARCWQVLDTDADGLLQEDGELPRAIAASGHAPSPVLIRHMMNSCPEEWRGRGVDFDTFVNTIEAYAASQPLREASLRGLAGLAEAGGAAASREGRGRDEPSLSWQQARGVDFGKRFATAGGSEERGGAAAQPVLPGFVIRRLLKIHLLSGTDGAPSPSMSDDDVDELLRSAELHSETDRMRLADLVAAVGGGMVHVLPEAVERAYPHESVRALFDDPSAHDVPVLPRQEREAEGISDGTYPA